MLAALGGDAVGMSTVLECIAARWVGLEVCGVSLVTNAGAGYTGEPLTHEEVLEAGAIGRARAWRGSSAGSSRTSTDEPRDGMTEIRLVQGDITRIEADAIVNAANSGLVGGGGVDGAIHRAGGPAVMADLVRRYGSDRHCPTGSAVVSDAGDLPARMVIHAVGPVWRGGGAGEAGVARRRLPHVLGPRRP